MRTALSLKTAIARLRKRLLPKGKLLQRCVVFLLIGSNFLVGFPIDFFIGVLNHRLNLHMSRTVDTARATSNTYDFSDCGSTCDTDSGWWASADDVDQFQFAGTAANRNTHTELVDADYTNLATSDDNRYAAIDPLTGDETLMWYEMTITENADSVQQLNFSVEGHPNTTTTTFTIWIKTAAGAFETDSSWTQVSTTTTITADTDATLTGSVSTNVSDYIDGGGKVIWGVYEAASPITIDVDYVSMEVIAAPLEQEGFRFRNDDGSETTATWLAAQDTNVTQPTATNTRLRMLINATGTADPSSDQYQLEYKLSTDSHYQPAEDATIATTTPVVQSRSAGATSAVDTASHAITMPSGITAGDLLLLIFSSDGARDVRIDSGDWVKLDENRNGTIVTGTIFYKFAQGSDTATVTTAAVEQSSHVVLRISGAGIPTSASTNASGTNSNPPSLSTVSSKNYLWVAARSGDSTVTASAAPTNYTNLQTQAAAGTAGASTNTAEWSSTASSEDPGTFTSATEQYAAFTIGIPPSSMGIKSLGTTGAGTTNVQVPYPSNDISTGDLLVLSLVNKFPTNSPTTPTGWTAPSNNQGTGGSGASAVDTGSVYTTVYTRIADGTETGFVPITVTSGDSVQGRMMVIKKEVGKVWNVALANGADSTANTAWSVTAGSDPGITAGDLVLVASGINIDSNTYVTHAVAATGVTFQTGNEGEVSEIASANGSDNKLVLSATYALSGSSSAAPVFTMTSSASATDSPTGASVFIRVRQDTAPIQLAASSNISAGGAATTYQLTAPASKSTSDFLAGRIQDDENPADAVNLSTSQYTELEWNITATAAASDTQVYQFRVTVVGAPLDAYTVTPQWTIGTVSSDPDVRQMHYRWRTDDGDETSPTMSGWYDTDWSYRKMFTVDNTKVAGSSNLTNFVMLVSVTDVDLKDTGNGGHVGQSDAGDILFTNASGTKLDHEIAKYAPATGQLVAWVEVDVLDFDTDTDIYLYYGNAGVADQWNITGTWSNSYSMVHHFNETSGAHLDATSNNNDSTSVSVTSQGAASSKIDGADDFNGTTNTINIADSTSLDITSFTIAGWFSVDTFPGSGQYLDMVDKSVYFLEVNGTDEINCGFFYGAYSDFATTTANISTGTYHHFACTFDNASNAIKILVDGVEQLSSTDTNSPSTNSDPLGVGSLSAAVGQFFDGKIDELYIADAARNNDWIITEYQNQNNPGVGGFLTAISSEEASGTSGASWAATQDTALTNAVIGTNYRLRLALSNENATTSGPVAYQIQVAETGTCSSGTYAAVPTDTSGDWQIAASTHVTDGSATTNFAGSLTDEGTTFVAGEVKDTGNTTSSITLDDTEFTELEFSVKPTSTATSAGDYCFRVSNTDTYTIYAEVTMETASNPTFTLSSYRWYVDSDSENVTDPWGSTNIAEDTVLAVVPATNTPPVSSDEIRLRVAITIGTATLNSASQQFKLQYKSGSDATCTSGSWTDVGALDSAEIWRFANSSVSTGSTLSVSKLTVSDVLQVYAKANPTATNPNSANTGQDIEYDFHLQHNGAASGSTYSFKVVKSDGTALGTYTNCPTLVTAPASDQLMRGGNVFVDEVEQGFTNAD